MAYCWRRHQIKWLVRFCSFFCFCLIPLKHTSGSASGWKVWTARLIATSILAWTLLVLIPALEMKILQSRMYYRLPMSTVHYAVCWWNIHLMTHFTNYISFPPFLFIYVILLCKPVSRRRHRLLKGQLWVWKVNDILILQCHFFMTPAINTTFDLLQHAGEKNPYTYFNHNINSCAISLRGKKMSFCSFVIENHNKIYGSVNCTESHERFIFIHHASSQRTLRTFPEYDSLMPSKGSTMSSATSWANPHLNYCYKTYIIYIM